MDDRETLEARFLGRGGVVLDVWYYYYVDVVYVAYVMLHACSVVYI